MISGSVEGNVGGVASQDGPRARVACIRAAAIAVEINFARVFALQNQKQVPLKQRGKLTCAVTKNRRYSTSAKPLVKSAIKVIIGREDCVETLLGRLHHPPTNKKTTRIRIPPLTAFSEWRRARAREHHQPQHPLTSPSLARRRVQSRSIAGRLGSSHTTNLPSESHRATRRADFDPPV